MHFYTFITYAKVRNIFAKKKESPQKGFFSSTRITSPHVQYVH